MSSSTDKKKKARQNKIKGVAFVLSILILFLVGYFFFARAKPKQVFYEPANPTFTVLENKNPEYKIVVSPDQNVKILTIAKKYYGKPEYWPYILLANEKVIDNPLDIAKGVVIKIPKIDAILLDKDGLKKTRLLGDSLLKRREKPVGSYVDPY